MLGAAEVNFWNCWLRNFIGQMSYMLPNQHCQALT